uniref:hypothetical protein n=1 Tax=Rhodococcus qingshengii TaxID=334542 RepID=UPI001C4E0C59|nr:hypothetical protein [Rhodococcus qingshengii]
MDAERIGVVESGVLTASDEQWKLALSRLAVLAPLAGADTNFSADNHGPNPDTRELQFISPTMILNGQFENPDAS